MLSGSPSVLEIILQSSHLINITSNPLPVYGPYHGQATADETTIDEFLEPYSSALSTLSRVPASTLTLTVAHKDSSIASGLDARTLLSNVLSNILTQDISAAALIQTCTEHIQKSGSQACRLVVCGASATEVAVIKALQEKCEVGVTSPRSEGEKSSLEESYEAQTSSQPKLAIVGMAGRFPDAADHEKFWELLEAGRDLHRRVGVNLEALGALLTTSAKDTQGPF